MPAVSTWRATGPHLLEQEGYTATADGWGYIRRNANEFGYQFSTPAQPQEEPGMAMQ